MLDQRSAGANVEWLSYTHHRKHGSLTMVPMLHNLMIERKTAWVLSK